MDHRFGEDLKVLSKMKNFFYPTLRSPNGEYSIHGHVEEDNLTLLFTWIQCMSDPPNLGEEERARI